MSEYIHDSKVKELELKANEIRQSLIEMLVEAKSGHTAGPLGMADIFTAFYFHIIRAAWFGSWSGSWLCLCGSNG